MLAKKTSPKKNNSNASTASRPASKAKRAPPKKKAAASRSASKAKHTPPKKKATASKQAGSSTQKKKTRKKRHTKSDGLGAEAIRIVEQAASILEQEISAGIVAAKKVEECYVNVDALRTAAPEQVMQRFRADAHEVLDIVLDMINLSINAVGGLSGRVMNIRSTTVPKGSDNNKEAESITELVVAEILKPETSGQVGMLVENDNDSATGKFSFITAGLLNAEGDRLDAKYISFEPADLEITAHDLEKVTIKVSIPKDAAPGQYSGVIQAPVLQIRVLLSVQVQT